MKQNKTLILFILFGCIGITAEIFFTAIYSSIKLFGTPEFNLRLMGQSYIWMFPIYGCIAFMGRILIERIQGIHLIFRALIYAVIIFIFEFFTGWLLDVATGSCPWEYKEGLQICGYIRLDYTPAWMGFGLLVEQIYLFSNSVLSKSLEA